MSAGLSDDVRLAYYSAAREEMLVHLKQRDLAILSFVAVMGAYFGFVVTEQVSKPPAASLLWTETITVLALPAICACFMLLYQQHHIIIAMLERYINVELFPDDGTAPPPYDRSNSVGRLRGLVHDAGFFGQSGLIASPLLYGFVYWIRNRAEQSPVDLWLVNPRGSELATAVFWLMIGSFALIVLIAIYGWSRRQTLRRGWRNS